MIGVVWRAAFTAAMQTRYGLKPEEYMAEIGSEELFALYRASPDSPLPACEHFAQVFGFTRIDLESQK